MGCARPAVAGGGLRKARGGRGGRGGLRKARARPAVGAVGCAGPRSPAVRVAPRHCPGQVGETPWSNCGARGWRRWAVQGPRLARGGPCKARGGRRWAVQGPRWARWAAQGPRWAAVGCAGPRLPAVRVAPRHCPGQVGETPWSNCGGAGGGCRAGGVGLGDRGGGRAGGVGLDGRAGVVVRGSRPRAAPRGPALPGGGRWTECLSRVPPCRRGTRVDGSTRGAQPTDGAGATTRGG